ncbi:FeS assembly SUF system protein SufT [mine drainage metagenome]|uniref:FeS assembly SUF system protein SufT n=2 Tax=mine drainage metagenome TaxID=410659 RepID=T0ZS36_9ZZZZ
MRTTDPVRFQRACEATLIPAGTTVVVPEGTEGSLTQALGQSFTVYVGGNLVRIDGRDADAIGKIPPEPLTVSSTATREELEALVWKQMGTCFDPEIPINIVDLGLVYDCLLEDMDDAAYRVKIRMTLTAPGCGMGGMLTRDVRERLLEIPRIREVDVELVFDPPWSWSMMSDAARLETGML